MRCSKPITKGISKQGGVFIALTPFSKPFGDFGCFALLKHHKLFDRIFFDCYTQHFNHWNTDPMEMLLLMEADDHPIQLELFNHQNLVEVEKDGTRYVLCHSPHRMDRDRATHQFLLERTEAKLQSLQKNGKPDD